MAKSEWRFREFKWNREGYTALKSTPAVRSLVGAKAKAIADRAHQMSGKMYGSSVETAKGRSRGIVAFVAPRSTSAKRDNEKNNTLLKAVGEARTR